MKHNSLFRNEPCHFCNKLGKLSIVKNARMKKAKTISETCPLCNGKGVLKIFKEDLEH